MTSKQADALVRMQRVNAALTPEQRKARSAKAAAASAARTAQRRAAAEAGNVTPASTAGVKAQDAAVKANAPTPMRKWRVLVSTKAGMLWHDCEAGGMQRAGKLARKAHKGGSICGVLLASVALPGK